ncbi:MAG: FtsX-like permease family protein, partial [Bacteroidota bacterium]
IETLFLALIGIIIGSLLGQLMNIYFETHPITFTGEFAKIYEDYGFLPQIVSASRITIVLTVAGFMVLVSFLSCIYPAYKVSKLEPLKGIRYT